MSPPRILLVTNMWPTPADPSFGIFVREQVEAVRAQGFRVDVAFVDGRAGALNYVRAIPKLRRLLRSRHYDLVHAHYVLAAVVVWLAGARRAGRPQAGARRASRPLVITHHGIEVFEGWQAPLARWITGRADRALVISAPMARHLDLGPDAVVPCGVDTRLFRPGDRAAARARLGLDPAAPLVAWIGADRPEKRLALARAAVDALRESTGGQDVRGGRLSIPAAELLVVSGLPHDDVPLYLRAADVLVVTSTREGGPLVVKEALACGRPVVSTDVGDVRDVVAGVPGCAIVPPDPVAIAAALRRALDHGPIEIDGPAAAAPFAAERIAERIASIYTDIAAPRIPIPRPLRILVLRQGDYPDDPRVRRMVGALAGRGHEVDMVCLRRAGQLARETVAGARVYRVPLAHRRAGWLRYVWEYGAFFVATTVIATALHLRHRYDIVQVHTLPDALAFAALGPKMLGAKVVLDLHEVMPELFASQFEVAPGHWLPRVLGQVEQAAIRFADACIAVSAPCLDVYVGRGTRRSKFTVVMNSADPALFRWGDIDEAGVGREREPLSGEPASGRLEAGAPGDRPLRIVSHGTLVPRHGFDVLLRAVKLIRDTRAFEFRLDIYGDGEARPALERLAIDLGLGDRVTFAGFVPLDGMSQRLAGADIGVVANRSDAFMDLVVPTKLMEYAALGIPAVAARTPAVTAYFQDSMVRFVTPGDPSDLAAALTALAADPGLRRRLADAARDGFDRDYGWPGMARHYIALIESLAENELSRVGHNTSPPR